MTRTYGKITHVDQFGKEGWIIECEPHVMVRLKRIFPKANKHRRGAMTLLDTPDTAADLRWVLERWPMLLDELDAQHLTHRANAYDEAKATVRSILDGRIPQLELRETALPLRSYQEEAAALVLTTGRLLLIDELGLGKTASALGVLRQEDALPAAVVTLTHLPTQWLGELTKFLPWLRGHVVTKGTPYDLRRGGVDPDVVILNYAKLAGWGDHLQGKVRTVIFDEMQELRRHMSLKYEAAAQVADGAKYRVGLTATPIYNYGGEIYNVISVLDREALGSSEEFHREWGSGTGMKISVNDPEALGSHLREEGLMLRRTRKQVGRELPEVQRLAYPIELDEDTLEEGTEGAAALAEMILAGAGTNTQLFQAAGDFDWRLRHATGVAKARHVADFTRMLLETGEPIVLFGWHRDVYSIWAERLRDHHPEFFTGSESANQKLTAQGRFMRGETNLLIMSLRAGAGLDGLQERAHVCVFGELDWSPGVHAQCVGRLHRDGQDDPVVAYFLVAESGSDPAIAEVLDIKRQQAEGIVDPDRALLTTTPTQGDRIKLLAQSFLATRKDGGHGSATL